LDRPREFRNLLKCSRQAAATKSGARPERTRQQPQWRKLKTCFPLDLVAGFAQCRLTGTTNRIYKVEAEKLDMI
jgi:hypothetical protein